MRIRDWSSDVCSSDLMVHDGHGLAYLQNTARERRNVFEALMEAVKTHSLGQISHALYDVGGEYRRNMWPLPLAPLLRSGRGVGVRVLFARHLPITRIDRKSVG